MTESTTLTSQQYWEKYYDKKRTVSRESIIQVCSAYDIYWDKMIKACSRKPKSIIEIGAYPGRYLAYLAAKYQLHPTALDYNSDRSKIEESFEVMGVSDYNIIQADFLKHETNEKYDLVISNGFIEHFKNFDEILDRHCNYLNSGGVLFVMIPNKRFLRKWYGFMVDYANLKMHNLKSMRLSVFRAFAYRNKLNIELLTYYGGFPYSVHQKLNFPQKIIYQIFRQIFKRINSIIEKYPNRFLSSSIIAIYTSKQ